MASALDPRNNPVSTNNVAALTHYETALKRFQNYFGDPIASIDAALDEAPDFILAHLFKSAAFYLATERRTLATAEHHLQQAQALMPHANNREKLLFAALDQLVAGQWREARVRFDAVLEAYPTDVFALQCGHVLDFFCGDALNLRNRPARVLPDWPEDLPGYSYVLGMHAFGLEECNQYSEAEQTGLQALHMNPIDPWCIHAVTHVYEMQNRTEDGIAFLEERMIDWAPDNGFAYHNWWHLGLMYLEHNNTAKVLQLIDEKIFADVSDALVLLDVTAMLWRLHLLGIDVGERFSRLSSRWQQKMTEVGFYAFNDYHAALSFAACGHTEQIEDMLNYLQNSDPAVPVPHSNLAMTREIGLPLIQASLAFTRGQYAEVTRLIMAVRDQAYRFGGSHAQRDIINLTALSAAARAGNTQLTRHLMNERMMYKPQATLGQRIVDAAR